MVSKTRRKSRRQDDKAIHGEGPENTPEEATRKIAETGEEENEKEEKEVDKKHSSVKDMTEESKGQESPNIPVSTKKVKEGTSVKGKVVQEEIKISKEKIISKEDLEMETEISESPKELSGTTKEGSSDAQDVEMPQQDKTSAGQQDIPPIPVSSNDKGNNEPDVEGKKKKKKRKKKKRDLQWSKVTGLPEQKDQPEIEYVVEKIDLPRWDINYAEFSKIFDAFKLSDTITNANVKEETKKEEAAPKKIEEKDPIFDEDDLEKEQETEEPKLSKKKLKLLNRLSVAELKQLVHRPDVVEMHDVNAKDPRLLVYLKAYRNTVPVPRHWCFKRKYLQGKRGFVKPPFELPEFIRNTGIMEMRAAMQEKEDQKTMKAKQRSKVRPKLGKIDIDYQKLHDAFFKYQTKPKMTIHGDLYYEGKEFETKLKEKKPGDLSDELRTALGMPIGPGKQLIPPPWLIAMQRYGPPPSYPNLKIPGLNAPIPEGASFGYHAGGWGKPPVDEEGKPLYGDVFGSQQQETVAVVEDDDIDKTPWGELESEESSEEEEGEDEEEDEDRTGLITPGDAGLVTPSGLTSIPAGMETPDMIELRKRKEIEDAMEGGSETPALYTLLPEKRATVGGAMMGSAHVYDLAAGATRKGTGITTPAGEGVEIALDPSELELDPAAMSAKYEETMKEREALKDKEDLSDMVAEHVAKKKRKKPTDSGKGAKKYKEFKF